MWHKWTAKKVFSFTRISVSKEFSVHNDRNMSAADVSSVQDATALVPKPTEVASSTAGRPSTRQAVTNMVSTGQSPALSSIKYVICFNACATDINDHSANWRCLDSSGHWAQIDSLKPDHAMTLQERGEKLRLTSPTLEAVFGRHLFHPFCRVEDGSYITRVLTAYYPLPMLITRYYRHTGQNCRVLPRLCGTVPDQPVRRAQNDHCELVRGMLQGLS